MPYLAEYHLFPGFQGGTVGKESACQSKRLRRQNSIPGSRRSPGRGNGNSIQYSCLKNSIDNGAWQATVRKELDTIEHIHMHACTYPLPCNIWIQAFPFPLYCLKASKIHLLFRMNKPWFLLLIPEESWWLSVQFSHSVMSDSLWPQGLQQARPPCPPPPPGVYPNSCSLSQWYHPTISSSVVPFSSHLQSFQASGSLQMSQFFVSGGQSIGVSASTSVFQWTLRTDLL